VNVSDRDGDGVVSSNEKVFEGWRGTPQLFAHVIRTVHAIASTGKPGPQTLLIDVQLKKDHERFSSVEDFLQNVTSEALQHFSRIDVESSGERGMVNLTLRWLVPWWKFSSGFQSDAVVELKVTGDSDWADNARDVISNALERGWRKISWKGLSAALLSIGISLSTFLIVFFTGYLFEWPHRLLWALFGGFVSFFPAAWAGTWVIPTLEIAPSGQSRLWRTVKVTGTVVTSLVIAGLSKKLFG
jgi:hypothetical protein